MSTNTIQIPEGYKQTKVGLIPEDWYVKPVSEVFEYIRTKSYSRDNLTFDEMESNVFYIHYGDIHSKYSYGILDFEKEELIPRLKKEFITNDLTFLNEGDLILADASEDYEGIGTAIELKNIGTKKVIGGLHTFALRDYAGFTSKGYRGYLLKNRNVVKSIWKITTGISVLGISKGNFSNIILPVPPLPEQKNIVDCLSTWDKAIEKQQALIEQKEFQKKGLMQQLLSGKKRLNGFEEQWQELRVEDFLLSFQNGYAFASSNYMREGVPIVTMGNIGLNGKFNFNYVKCNYWDISSVEKLEPYTVRKGDLLMAMTDVTPDKNLIGIMAIVDLDDTFYLNQRVGLLRIDTGKVNPFFISALSIMSNWRNYSISSATLGVQANLSTKDIKRGKMKLPSLKEQTAIAEILRAADNEIELEKKRLQQLKDQKKGLMQQLLSGKKRLNFSLEPVY